MSEGTQTIGLTRGYRHFDCAKDKGISLKKLYDRDNGICYLCGGKCKWTENKYDPEYPTVDHVTPLSNGGNHTWDNVRLAHRQCNMVKNAKPWSMLSTIEPRKKRFLVYVTDRIDTALRDTAERTGKPVNELINQLLSLALLGEDK